MASKSSFERAMIFLELSPEHPVTKLYTDAFLEIKGLKDDKPIAQVGSLSM